MSWTQKRLRATISLQNGQFQGGGNSLTLSDMRMRAEIEVSGSGNQVLHELAIYGLTLSHMNQLSQIGGDFASATLKANSVKLEAGDTTGTFTTIFEGNILYAFPDLGAMPQGCFRISEATGAISYARQTMAPTTRKGPASADSLFQALAGQLGLQLENNGVKTMLSNPYLHGSALMQVRQLAEAVGCVWHVENMKTLAVWPAGKARKQGSSIPVIKEPEMVGFPSFSQATIFVTTQFDPAIRFGDQIKVESKLKAATGQWTIGHLQYELESMTPHGHWFQHLSMQAAGGTSAAGGTGG